MGAPVTKQKKQNHAYHNSYYDPSNKNLLTNVIKKAHKKLESTHNSASKPFSSIEKNQTSDNKPKNNENDIIFSGIQSYRSDLDVIPQDDLPVIRKFMENQIVYKESNIFAKPNININCNFEERLFSLSDELIFLTMSFILDEYYTLIALNSVWYYKINEVLDNKFIEIDNQFIQAYLNYFSLKKGYNSFTPLIMHKTLTNTKKFRIDRNLTFEILPAIENKSIILKYTYQFPEERKDHCAEYQFDIISKDLKNIWIYKEDMKVFFPKTNLNTNLISFNNKYNYDKTKRAFVQSIMPVSLGDEIKIAINIFNIKGLVDIKTIKWKDISIEEIQTVPKILSEENIYSIQGDRVCELETLLHEWVPYEYYMNKSSAFLDNFQPYMALKEVKCCGFGMLAMKMIYHLKKEGFLPNALKELGVNILIRNKKDEIKIEVKRKGLAYDLEDQLEMRVGDYLTFYLSKAVEK